MKQSVSDNGKLKRNGPSIPLNEFPNQRRVCSLHQISPYIGKLKPSIARSLIQKHTAINQTILDPFCGSGTIALEAVLLNRNVIANDFNPYAVALTKAKITAPKNLRKALIQFEKYWDLSRDLVKEQDLRKVPIWVRKFFHPNTLKSLLAFREVCIKKRNYFLLSCLLGILHHQTRGFLSFPSSHLVPYLRDKKFPKNKFPELYEERDVHARMIKKIERVYNNGPQLYPRYFRVSQKDARKLLVDKDIDVVITSPPYMNELDYVRDNRLRLWILTNNVPYQLEIKGVDQFEQFKKLIKEVFEPLSSRITNKIILVLGEISRNSKKINTAIPAIEVFKESEILSSTFKLANFYIDKIPDNRRSRRNCRSTTSETVLIFKRIKKNG